jgi:ABC-type oligopeptide transport system substrate-binding subunit
MTLDRERLPARHRRFAWRISGILILLALHVGFVPTASAQSQMTWALQVSLVPAWFDPSEFSPVQTSLMVISALHDALVKPMPGQPLAPSLAESWQVSKDGLVYEFTLRSGVLFHNGERVTADDVKFPSIAIGARAQSCSKIGSPPSRSSIPSTSDSGSRRRGRTSWLLTRRR